jgi:hypothetical protein
MKPTPQRLLHNPNSEAKPPQLCAEIEADGKAKNVAPESCVLRPSHESTLSPGLGMSVRCGERAESRPAVVPSGSYSVPASTQCLVHRERKLGREFPGSGRQAFLNRIHTNGIGLWTVDLNGRVTEGALRHDAHDVVALLEAGVALGRDEGE